MVVLNRDQVLLALAEVKDPEIPAVSVVDLGLIRKVEVEAERVEVWMTPTFLGCPAVEVMRADIARRIRGLGAAEVEVHLSLSPPWSSDWITEAGRQRLKDFGLAPPIPHNGLIQISFTEPVVCPYCGSMQTTLKNSFGPTLCRSLYYCHGCQQPFEQFKAL
jgi:ring-1,2-phenylacetyl-CoA epoxidase subunit PaaD